MNTGPVDGEQMMGNQGHWLYDPEHEVVIND